MSNSIAIKFLGLTLDFGKVSTAILLLILAEAVLTVVALVVFFGLLARKSAGSKQRRKFFAAQATPAAFERTLVGITVDASAARRDFRVGEPFYPVGLVVTANYSGEPASETVTDYTLDEPPMDRAGRQNVAVRYGGFTAYYSIDVVAPEDERIPVGLELDLSAVRREFVAGEAFDYGGLAVRMKYSREPFYEEVFHYTVDIPSMEEAGEKTVAVRCDDFVEFYQVNVAERPREE